MGDATDRAMAQMRGDAIALGRNVIYQDPEGYRVPALIVGFEDTERTVPERMKSDTPTLTSSTHVHLLVFDPWAQGQRFEYDVPFDPRAELEGAWSWPTKVETPLRTG